MSSFNNIYDEHFEKIIRIAYRITGELETAEDLCQDTFVKYFEKYGEKKPKGNISFLLIKIVKNLSFNHERRLKIESRVFKQYQSDKVFVEKDTGLTSLVKKEQISDIQKALLLIPYKYRLPLVLREYESMSYKEIGKLVSASESNVKVLIHRAKKTFKEKIKEIEHG